MSTAPEPSDRSVSPRFVGFFVALIGVGVAGMGRLHPERARADLWVVYAAGGAFFFAGLAVMFSPPPGTPPGEAGPLSDFFGACVITCMAALFGWWAFLARTGGDRVRIGPVSFLAGGRWAWIARAPVAVAAFFLAAAAAYAWKAFADSATRSRPEARAPLRAALLFGLGWGAFQLLRPAPPPDFGALAFEVPLNGSLGSASLHGNVSSSPEGAVFGGEADWLDYALPANLRLDGSAALVADVRAERRGGKRRSAVETFATAGPYVLDSDPSSDSWRVKASVGDCSLISDPLEYGKWTTVALAYDEWKGRAALFVDGKRIDRVACAKAPPERLDTLRLGTWHESYQAFTGALRSVRIYTRVGDI